MALTWKNVDAPSLQTNFNKVDLGGGFSKIGEYLSTIGENQRVKEKEDITNTLISDLTRYTGKDGEESLGALRSSGALSDTLTALGNKVDSKAVMGALLSSQDRLAQENQRIQATQEKDRLLAQKPYVDVADTLIAQGNLEGARNYVNTLASNGNIDTDISAKIFHAARKAEEDAAQNQREQARFNLSQATGKLQLDEAQIKKQQARDVENFTRMLQTGVFPENTAEQAPKPTTQSGSSLVDKSLAKGTTNGYVPPVLEGYDPVPANTSTTFNTRSDGKKATTVEPLVLTEKDVADLPPPQVVVQPKVPITRNATTVKATVVEVIDGDTLDLKTGQPRRNTTISRADKNGSDITCRVDLINAPETAKPFADPPKPGAKGSEEAYKKLKDLVSKGEVQITVTNDGNKDKYGRNICQIEVSGNDVGLEMVAQGAVRLYQEYGNPEAYAKAGQAAKDNRAGLFAPTEQEKREDAQTALLKRVLSDPNTPAHIYKVAATQAEQLEKQKLERNQRVVTMRANELALEENKLKTSLSVEGLTGETIGKNPDALISRLKKAGITSDDKMGWVESLYSSNPRDQYQNIVRTINSDKNYQDVDSGIVVRMIEKAFVDKGDQSWATDRDFSSSLKEQLQDYVKSDEFADHKRLLKDYRERIKFLRKNLDDSLARDLRINAKGKTNE